MSFKNHRNRPNRIIDINGKLFKLNEVIDKTATDIHHLIGQKYRHQYNVNVEENKVRIPRRKHGEYIFMKHEKARGPLIKGPSSVSVVKEM